MKSGELYGLILAGGESKRMGIDKSTINFHGVPQHEYLNQLLKKYCKRVFTSIGKTSQTADFINPIRDVFDLSSPIDGIASAFHSYPNVAWLSVPIDMPTIDGEVIEKLLDGRDTEKVATCYYDSEGYSPEPLLAIWEPVAGAKLMKFIQQGHFSPREFLKMEMANILQPPTSSIHLNINTPEELTRWKTGNKNS